MQVNFTSVIHVVPILTDDWSLEPVGLSINGFEGVNFLLQLPEKEHNPWNATVYLFSEELGPLLCTYYDLSFRFFTTLTFMVHFKQEKIKYI